MHQQYELNNPRGSEPQPGLARPSIDLDIDLASASLPSRPDFDYKSAASNLISPDNPAPLPKGSLQESGSGAFTPPATDTTPGKGEYYRNGNPNASPADALWFEIGSRFERKDYLAATGRLVLGAAPIALSMAGQLVEIGGCIISGLSLPTFPLMLLTGSSMAEAITGVLSAGALGLALWGTGALVNYGAQRICHNVRQLFGDTRASWRESLSDGRYPFRSPKDYI